MVGDETTGTDLNGKYVVAVGVGVIGDTSCESIRAIKGEPFSQEPSRLKERRGVEALMDEA